VGCSSDDNNPTPDAGMPDSGVPDSGVPDSGTPDGGPSALDLTALSKVTAAASDPMDTAVSADGKTVYFTGYDSNGSAAVFKTTAGSAPQVVFSGAPLVAPTGLTLSGNGSTLYVADVGAATSFDDGGTADLGQVFSLPTSGGSPTAVAISGLAQPVNVDTASDGQLLISGRGTDGTPGVFKVPAAGGAAGPAVASAGLTEPSGAADVGGSLFVADQGGPGYGALYRFSGGTGTAIAAGVLRFGTTAGLASAAAGDAVVAGATDESGQGALVQVSADGVTVTRHTFNGELSAPSGLSRAAGTNSFAVADGDSSAASLYLAR
jgi:hypothetical protein